MILIAFLCEVLKDVSPELWGKMYLSYDNMYIIVYTASFVTNYTLVYQV